MVGAVVEDEALVVEPAAEVGAKQGEDPVFGGDLPHQCTAQVREAGEAPEQVDLPVQVAHGLHQGVYRFVAEAVHQVRAEVIEGADEAVEHHLPLLGAGEKALLHQLQGVGGAPVDAAENPLGVGLVALHPLDGEQGGV